MILPLAAVLFAVTVEHQGSGPALLAGAGTQTGGIGLEVIYYWRPGERPWHLAGRAGAGVRGLDPEDRSTAGWCAGASLIYGYRNRALVALDYGLVKFRDLFLHGTPVAARALLGPQAALGYEHVGSTGVVIRVVAGAGYVVTGPIAPSEGRTAFVATLALGWKPW